MGDVTISTDEFADTLMQMIVDGTNEIIEDTIREVEEEQVESEAIVDRDLI